MTHCTLFLILIFVSDVRASVKDEVETVEVTEGVNVTLRTNLTGIKSDDMIRWTFGTTDTRIAQLVNSGTVSFYNGIFTNRLNLDKQTGSLTISDISFIHSGVYKQQLISEQVSDKHFSVTVYGTLPMPTITSAALNPRCSVVCSVRNVGKMTLSWFRGSQLLSNISDPDNSTLMLPLDIEHCDRNSYSCVAANPISIRTVQLNTSIYCCYTDCIDRGSINVLSIVVCHAVLIATVLLLALYLLIQKLQNKGLAVTELIMADNYMKTVYSPQTEGLSQEEPMKNLDCTLSIVTYYSGLAHGGREKYTKKSLTFHSIMKRREQMWMDSSFIDCFSRIHFFLLLHLVVVNDVKASVKDEVETVEVTEGVNVTLRTNLTGIKSDDMIRWTFGTTDTRIAQLVNSGTVNFYNGIFTNRLNLDKQTGSLTISNISFIHSGVYKQQLISEQVSDKHFSVTVYATLPVPYIIYESQQNHSQSKSLSSPRCSVVCSVRNVGKMTLSWFRGSQLLSNISDPDNSTLMLPLDIEHCDRNTYICVAANPISIQTVQLNTTCSCFPTGGNRVLWWLIPVLILLLLALVAAYLLYRNKIIPKNREEVQSPEEEVHYAETMFYAKRVQNMKPEGPEDTVYSRQLSTVLRDETRQDVRAAGQDKVETIEVKEGVNVTLRTNLTGIKSDDMIRWMFGDTRIAQLVNTDSVSFYNGTFNGTFKNRLKMDKKTGSLTISNIRTTDSGDYEQQLMSEKTSTKQFRVTVYAPVPVPTLKYGFRQNQSGSKMPSNPNCSMVCSVRNAFKVTLSWFRGSQLLSNVSDSSNSTLSLPLEIKHGDNDTYICVAANPISNQTVPVKRTCTQNSSTIGTTHT
ncbi:uncharacterized protein LOC118803753 [Colossoma macropomum]|uniref:uncharacterized protein LOC118803753 n=1 Tax=Colossoma macropomum TaxID=42526 RepID=UPI001864F793|nr:uncharacterized protein LOC118803753 [Colossoma macropomum]